MISADPLDLAPHIERVARHLFGEPNRKLSKREELRFGTHGSLAVMIAGSKRGTWFDHEKQIGGGVSELLLANGEAAIADWFARELGIDLNPSRQHIVATYDYADEAGKLLFQVLRYGPTKTFSQQQPGAGKGGIKRNPKTGKPTMEGARYVPYHLDELVAARAQANGKPWRVYIAEGEKDADRLRQWGLTATCNAGGVMKWRADYGRYFTGAEAILLADNDEAGRAHVADVAKKLAPVAAVIKIPALHGLPEKGDVSDWLAAGGSQGDLEDLVDSTEATHEDQTGGPDPAIWIDDGEWDEDKLPPRPWAAPGYALRGAVTLVTGPPSAKKSTLMLAWGCALALGRPHGKFRPTKSTPVVVYNVEDDRNEQRRRLSAVLRQFDATPADIRSKIVRTGPAGVGVLFAWDAVQGLVINTQAMDALRALCAERRPGLLIADPLAELHTAGENDNTALRAIVATFRAIAIEFDMAVIIVHHTRKGAAAPGDPDSARGGSAIIGAARIVLTCFTMSEEDAESFGLPKDRKTRSNYLRLDDAKQNYAGIGEAVWYDTALHTLSNGEIVPAVVPFEPPDKWAAISIVVANEILDEIDAGLDSGTRRYVHGGAAEDRAAWKVVTRHVPALNEQQARDIISTYLKNGVLAHRKYYDPKDRKERQGLYLNEARRPGAMH